MLADHATELAITSRAGERRAEVPRITPREIRNCVAMVATGTRGNRRHHRPCAQRPRVDFALPAAGRSVPRRLSVFCCATTAEWVASGGILRCTTADTLTYKRARRSSFT